MQKTPIINRIIGITGLIIALLIVLNFLQANTSLVDFSEKYISHDHHVKPNTILLIKIFLSMCILLIAISSMLFLLNLAKKVFQTIINFLQVNDPTTSNICSKKYIDFFILAIGTILGFFLSYHFFVFGEPVGESFIPTSPANENIMEKVFALLLLFSIIILISSITRVKREFYSVKMRRKIIFLIIAISGMIILILGEEISWGQRISGLDSFGIFNEYNYQNETNIHNFLSPNILVGYIYPIVGVGSFIVLFLIWITPKKRNSYFFNLFFPHPSLFFLVLMMMVLSFYGGGGETYEHLFTIFVLLYCFRIYMCLTFPNIHLLSRLN